MSISNYDESDVFGTKHTRCKKVVLINEYGQTPRVEFVEERVHVFDDGTHVAAPVGTISVSVDMASVIEDEEGNSISYADLYRWIAIAYIATATERDAQQAGGE